MHAYTCMQPPRNTKRILRPSVNTHFQTQSHIQIQLQLLLLFRVLTPLWRHVVKAERSCEENTDAQGKQC